ncbi:MAG: hypothetical protein M0C28_27710 [Candidatus Moduliflexus flocculans]|nr:hypothetical protein [Candidatus Moduliflexus flocculans]
MSAPTAGTSCWPGSCGTSPSSETDGLFTFSAVVVDNDPEGPARPEVERLRSELPSLEIIYEHRTGQVHSRGQEPRPAAGPRPIHRDHRRRRVPPAGLAGRRSTKAFGLTAWTARWGRSFLFREPAPAWLVKSGLLDLPRWRTGTRLRWSQTCSGNVLLKKQVFDRDGLRFDVAYRTGDRIRPSSGRRWERASGSSRSTRPRFTRSCRLERWSKSYFVRRALGQRFQRPEVHRRRAQHDQIGRRFVQVGRRAARLYDKRSGPLLPGPAYLDEASRRWRLPSEPAGGVLRDRAAEDNGVSEDVPPLGHVRYHSLVIFHPPAPGRLWTSPGPPRRPNCPRGFRGPVILDLISCLRDPGRIRARGISIGSAPRDRLLGPPQRARRLLRGRLALLWPRPTPTLSPGDTVYLRGGTYGTGIRPVQSGSAGNPITFQAYPGETPTFRVDRRPGRHHRRPQLYQGGRHPQP